MSVIHATPIIAIAISHAAMSAPIPTCFIGDRNQKSNKNPNSTKNMEQIFRKELMDFFHGKTLPFSVDNIVCSIVSYALCFFKPSQVIGEAT